MKKKKTFFPICPPLAKMGQPQPAQTAQTSQTTFGFRRWNYIRSHCRVHHHSTVICRKEIILFLHSFCKVQIFWDGHKNVSKSPNSFLTLLSTVKGNLVIFWNLCDLLRIYELYLVISNCGKPFSHIIFVNLNQ